jgi:queuine/archaeosine tRNA-ribosyltransferase
LKLIEEEDFTVKDWDTGESWSITDKEEAVAYLDYLEDQDGINHIHRRACHNLNAFNFESKRVREEIENGELESFILGRMKSTVYRKRFDYAIEQKH